MQHPGKIEPEYLEMDSNGALSLVPASKLGSKGPHQFVRINNDDGTTSLRSKTHKRLVEAGSGSCNRTKFGANRLFIGRWEKRSAGKLFKMVACNNEQAFVAGHGGVEYEFESNWFYGFEFFILFKRIDGSINVVLAQTNKFSFETAEISGKVVSDESDSNPTIERMLRVKNLHIDNLGHYHLKISGKKKQLCYDGFIESAIKTALVTRRKTLVESSQTRNLCTNCLI